MAPKHPQIVTLDDIKIPNDPYIDSLTNIHNIEPLSILSTINNFIPFPANIIAIEADILPLAWLAKNNPDSRILGSFDREGYDFAKVIVDLNNIANFRVYGDAIPANAFESASLVITDSVFILEELSPVLIKHNVPVLFMGYITRNDHSRIRLIVESSYETTDVQFGILMAPPNSE